MRSAKTPRERKYCFSVSVCWGQAESFEREGRCVDGNVNRLACAPPPPPSFPAVVSDVVAVYFFRVSVGFRELVRKSSCMLNTRGTFFLRILALASCALLSYVIGYATRYHFITRRCVDCALSVHVSSALVELLRVKGKS